MADLVPVDHDPFAAPSALEGSSPSTPSWSPTTLSPEDEVKFQRDMTEKPEYKAWADTFQQRFGESPNLNDPQYDYRGAWQGGIVPTPYEPDQNFPHWPSALPSGQMLKAPDHPTAWMEHFMREYNVDPNLATPDMIDEGRSKGLVPQDWHGPGLGGSEPVPGPQSALGDVQRPAGRFGGMAGLGSNPTEKVLFGGQQGAANLGPGSAGPADITAAKVMEGTKSSADQIFASTGWYRGPDGEWKWVLPDKDISLNKYVFDEMVPNAGGESLFRMKPAEEGETPLLLSKVIDHPDLFKAYPEFASTTVGALPNEIARQGVVADYNPRTNEIRLGTGTQTDVLSSLLHEVQHHIQNTEGFASGGNSNMFLPRDYGDRAYKAMIKMKAARESIDKINPDISSYAMQSIIERHLSGEDTPNIKSTLDFYSKNVPKDVFDNFAKLVKDEVMPIRKMENDAFENYRQIAGETESRQVQKQFETQNWSTRPTAMPGFAPATEQHIRRNTDPYGKFTPGVSYHEVDYDPFNQRPSALGQEM